MPIYEYECPRCHRTREVYHSVGGMAENVYCELCQQEDEGAYYPIMQRIVSMPAPHRLGGAEGKLKTAELVRKRNEAYHKSAAGRDEYRANVEAARKRGLPA